jgi:hemerythrin-like domain-containing protein
MFNPFKKERFIVWHNDTADRVIVERNWFQRMLYPICFATCTEVMRSSCIKVEIEAAEKFVKHIKSHLDQGEAVVCKICNKSVEEIYLENR